MDSLHSAGEPDRPEIPTDYALWLRYVRAAQDLATLVRILQPLLPGLPLPCTCLDGTCDRCQLERILATHTMRP
jgi:hypothetical protein